MLAAVACLIAAHALSPGLADARKQPAKTMSITGTLSKPGYTVLALGYNGGAVYTRARSFTLRAPDRLVTLQLITGHGRYAGPVVVGGSQTKVIVGVRAGANLGLIRVSSAGYARTALPLASKLLDSSRWAYAKRGVPIGNGRNFGLVRSPGHASRGAGLDEDRDGVPDVLDVDANGNGVLDSLERGRLQAAAAAAPGFSWMSQVFLDLSQTLNADASGVTAGQIDAMLAGHLNLRGLDVPHGDRVELDCEGLSYCSPGGTGQVVADDGPNAPSEPFPSCCDPDRDGLGNLRGPGAPPLLAGPGGDEFSLDPNATAGRIGSGDTPVMRIVSGSQVTEAPVPIRFVFDTVPALARWVDGTGDAGTISYPAASGSPGTVNDPLALGSGSNGDVVLQLTIWRPQRRGIAGAGEPAFIDVGRLGYHVDVPPQAPMPIGANPSPQCSAASLSSADPSLSAESEPMQAGPAAGGFIDSAPDRPANPANTLSMTVDLTRCLADKGASGFPVGTELDVELEADAQGSADHANQKIWVRRAR